MRPFNETPQLYCCSTALSLGRSYGRLGVVQLPVYHNSAYPYPDLADLYLRVLFRYW
jgi:hypothetical protein